MTHGPNQFQSNKALEVQRDNIYIVAGMFWVVNWVGLKGRVGNKK